MQMVRNATLLFLGFVGWLWMSAGATLPVAAQSAKTEVVVPFFTLRNATGDADPSKAYGTDRSTLSSGRCFIEVTDLGFLTPLAEAAPFYVPETALSISKVETLKIEQLTAELARSAKPDRPVLYTHGYYVDFEKGCRRAKVLQRNSGLEGRFLWFSWPSDGSLTDYASDEADLYWSVPDMAEVIERLGSQFGPGRLNLAGHSLGSRGIVYALYEIANRRPDFRLGEVALLAPDMDFQTFSKLLPRIRPIVNSLTVYVAAADRPLALSAQLHGYPRLGETGNPVTSLNGVEVIDLSDLPVRSPTGHLYHIYNREVGEDLNQLFNEGKSADQRRNLVRSGQNQWVLQSQD